MRKYMPFEPLYLSFFSSAFYKDVARSWGGIGFLYLLLLQLFAWLVLSTFFYIQLGNLISTHGKHFAEQVPSVSIKDGTVTMDRPSPYVIKDGTGSPFLIIDTESGINKYEESSATIILTKHHLIVHKDRSNGKLDETRVFDLKEANGDISIDKASVEGLLEQIKVWVPILAFAVGLPFMVVLYLIFAVLNAALGLIAKAATNSDLDFGAILRISIVAMTPGVVLGLLHTITGLQLPIMGPFCLVLTLGYLVFGIVASKDPIDTPAVAPVGMSPAMPSVHPVNPSNTASDPNNINPFRPQDSASGSDPNAPPPPQV